MTPPFPTDEVPLADDPRTPTLEDPGIEPFEDVSAATSDALLVSESPPPDLGPIKAGERIAEMDILRGFALLGICVINLQNFLGPHGISGDAPMFPAWYDRTAEFLINLFGSGKFNAMFSFLFGVGFAIQMERADRSKAPFASMYVRRLLALMVFGAAHLIFLWDGDVLHIYAAIGLPLIFFRTLKDRWLWLLVVLTLVGPLVWFGVMSTGGEKPSPEKKEARAREVYDRAVNSLKVHGKGDYLIPPYMPLAVRKERVKAHDTTPVPATVKVTAQSTYPAVVSLRLRGWVRSMRKGAAIFWSIFATTLLIGFIAGRRRIFHDIPGHLRLIRWVAIISGVLGLAIAVVFATASSLAAGGMKGESLLGMVAGLAYMFGRIPLSICYMGVIVLVAQTDRFRRLLAPLALVGRMPLTNYLMHSVVFSLLFYGYAVGWFYRVGPALSLVIAFTLYAIQVVYSNWWMKRYRFGPMEWLWRTMTYGKPPVLQ